MINQRIRILLIVPRFGTINRGVETFTLELLKKLDKTKFDITVLSAPYEHQYPGITSVQMSVWRRESFFWMQRFTFLSRLLQLVTLGDPASIESFSLCIKAMNAFEGSCFDFILPLGGTWSYRLATRLQTGAQIIGIGQAGPTTKDLAYCSHFVALTPFDAEKARSISSSVPITVIPNGVDTNRYCPATDVTDHTDKKTILCVAALSPDKRHDLLFNAVLLMPDNVKVMCVGPKATGSELTNHPLAKNGRVEFKSCHYSDMPDLYHHANIFSLASPDEAFGIVFLEALASGLPVVAHDGPRQRYVIGDAGFLCNTYDAYEYSEALKRALSQKVNSAGVAQALKYDWLHIASRYEKLFQTLTIRSCNDKHSNGNK